LSSNVLDLDELLAAAETVEGDGPAVEAPARPRFTNGSAPRANGSPRGHCNGHHEPKQNGHNGRPTADHSTGGQATAGPSRKGGLQHPPGESPSPPSATHAAHAAAHQPVMTYPAADPSPDVIRLTCACGRRLRVKQDQAGRRIKCPKCGKALVPRVAEDSSAADPATASRAARAAQESFGEMADKIEAAASGVPQPAAARTLSWLRFRALAHQAVPPSSLSEDDVQPCRVALLELGQSRDRRAREIILPFVTSASSLLRHAAAAALGDLEDPSLAGPLVRLLGDESPLVRKAAVISLGKAGHRAAVRPLLKSGLSDPQLKFLASESVAKLAEAAVPELLDLVSGQDAELALEAIVLLGRIGDKRAVKVLISCVESRSPLLRCHAAESLGRIGDTRARGTLVALLDDPDASVRSNAAAALTKLADSNCLIPLVKALADDDADVRRSAASALGEVGDPRAAEPLVRLLHVKDEEFSLAIADSLARLGDERALPRLIELLQRPDEAVQLRAIAGLRKLSDSRAAPALYDALLCRSPQVRQRAVDALGHIGDAEAAERLELVLSSDRVTEVRAAAARALGEIADPASVDVLVRALDDEFNVRCVALGALGGVGDQQALPAVLRAAEDSVPEVRFHAVSALGHFKKQEAIEALQAAAGDESEMVRRAAVKSLERLGAAIDPQAAARARRARKVRSRVVDWHMALPALLAAVWPDSARGRAIATGVMLAVGIVAVLFWPRSNTPGGSAFPVRGDVRTLAFSPDGTKLALGRTFDLLEIWDPETGRLVSETAVGGTGGMAFGSDSQTLALVAHDKLRLWTIGDSDTGRDLGGHKSAIMRLAASADGRVAATLDQSGRALIWSLPDGEGLAGLDIDLRGLTAIDVTSDGKLLACGAVRGRVVVWDTESARPVHTLAGGGDVVAIAFSSDGSRLAASDGDGMIRVWDAGSGSLLMELQNEAQRAASLLRFHPDGNRLAAVTIATISIWDLTSRKATALPAVDAAVIETLTFSPEGRYLAAGGSEDRTAWIIDVEQGQVARTLEASR
jgi:HEAT repeat protein